MKKVNYMNKLKNKMLRRLNISLAFMLSLMMLIGTFGSTYVLASGTSNFTQTINAGSLAVDIVDASHTTVTSPTVAMSPVTFSFNCQTATGTFGTASEQIYVQNPDASATGWTASVAGSATTATWASAGTDFDFNDPTSSGCTDGSDTDNFGGQMTIDPSVGTLSVGICSSCTTSGVSLGSSSSFSEGATDTITILSGASASDDIGDWDLSGVSISQKIPLEQPAASDYAINMVLSIVAV